MPDQRVQRGEQVDLEGLLKLKRYERPRAEFWDQFDRDLHDFRRLSPKHRHRRPGSFRRVHFGIRESRSLPGLARGTRLCERARRDGVDATVDEWPEMVHGFQGLAAAGIPEAIAALVIANAWGEDQLRRQRPLEVSDHDDRWFVPPWGVNGGLPAKRSWKLLEKTDGSQVPLGSKMDHVEVNKDDLLQFYEKKTDSDKKKD